MNTPVSFPLARLLKDKNIHILSAKSMYASNGELTDAVYDFDNWCFAPTIADLVMWLYEKHQIWVHAMKSFKEFTPYIQCDWNYKQDAIKEVLKFMEKRFNSPTEAYEAAIEFTLNNLI